MRRSALLLMLALIVLYPAGARGGEYDAAFIPEEEYRKTIFVTPNGNVNVSGPMILEMMGGGDPNEWGGGKYAKAGIVVGIFYARFTEGADDDFKFYITGGKENHTMPLPPDVESLNQLPACVTDHLPDWATPAIMPRTIAGLEWARYCNVPISFQFTCIQSHGGWDWDVPGWVPADNVDLDLFFEMKGKDQCQLDAADICDWDDDPTTIEPGGASWGTFSFATPTLADPVLGLQMGFDLQYKSYVKRNLQMGIQQLLEICCDPRYAGRIAGFAMDPEIHMPAHENGLDFPRHPDYGGGTEQRAFFEDYHPVTCRQFAYYLRDRYGDDTPLADSNGDGVTFWGDFATDYLSSGWAAVGHSHSVPPATWEDIDPPRTYPQTLSSPRSPYYHAWCNFRVELVNDFLDEWVGWAMEAGLPPSRIFSHQTGCTASYEANRAQWENQDWMDDWCQTEIPGGYSGFSTYQPYGVNGYEPGGTYNGKFYYENMWRRDEGWGSPEYNPWIKNPYGPVPTGAELWEVRNCVDTAWEKGAHILWAQAWGAWSHPVIDVYSTLWIWDSVNGMLPGWTTQDFTYNATHDRLYAQSDDAYLEWHAPPGEELDAATYRYLMPQMHVHFHNPGFQVGDVRVQFQTQSDPTWDTNKMVTAHVLQIVPWGCKNVPVYLAGNPLWTGNITALRLYPVPGNGGSVKFLRVVAPKVNNMTTALRLMLEERKDTPRPEYDGPRDLVSPMSLADSIDDLAGTTNFTFYGTDADTQLFNTDQFFKASVSCGGVTREAISAHCPTLLGMRKTGKWRYLRLPPLSTLALSFRIGIEDGNATTDGARFRVYVRDEARLLHELFLEEWRWNQWSQEFVVDLSPFAGQTINLFLETQGIAKAEGDAAVWGEPTITSDFQGFIPSVVNIGIPIYSDDNGSVDPQEEFLPNGMFDLAELELLAAVLNDTGHAQHAATVQAFTDNRNQLILEDTVGVLNDDWLNYLAGMITLGDYGSFVVADLYCQLGSMDLEKSDYLQTQAPYVSARGDADEDGTLNIWEYHAFFEPAPFARSKLYDWIPDALNPLRFRDGSGLIDFDSDMTDCQDLDPDVTDYNGPGFLPNLMRDSDELAVIRAILADPRQPLHDNVRAAWMHNYGRIYADCIPAKPVEWAAYLAGLMTVGDDDSTDLVGAVYGLQLGLDFDPLDFDRSQAPYLAREGDADGDLASNYCEYVATSGFTNDREAYLAHVLDPLLYPYFCGTPDLDATLTSLGIDPLLDDVNANGIEDGWELKLMTTIMDHDVHPLHHGVTAAWDHNVRQMQIDLDPLVRVVGQPTVDLWSEYLGSMITTGDGLWVYQQLAPLGIHIQAGDYDFDGGPYLDDDGDADEDGYSNLAERAVSLNRDDYINRALNPNLTP